MPVYRFETYAFLSMFLHVVFPVAWNCRELVTIRSRLSRLGSRIINIQIGIQDCYHLNRKRFSKPFLIQYKSLQ